MAGRRIRGVRGPPASLFTELPSTRDCMKSGSRGRSATLARMRKYPTDLSDAEWNYIEPTARPQGMDAPGPTAREILNAVFYLLKSGCQWRLCPTTPQVAHRLLVLQEMAYRGTWEGQPSPPRTPFA